MHLVVCGSLSFIDELAILRDQLQEEGHTVTLPITAQEILDGTRCREELVALRRQGRQYEYAIRVDAIRRYQKEIEKGEAILVANYDKNGIAGYVGANTLLEMGFAHILHKPIYMLYPLPNLASADEMRVMQPVILDGDIKKLTV